ncbi:EF-hand calcium-binding domain-containing protein 6 [Caerostris darwini]|uniref:EF-hand calcium-binding domain-containing protein 6 n=1 Tax=Caerostris darwini TaxID=1538125 RepID=A0AAV4RQN6_9ARAC|nr:EF-hand calcium-binding domain-containing protein 6 [Caerostris darwini]
MLPSSEENKDLLDTKKREIISSEINSEGSKSIDLYTELSSISSFTHDSQQDITNKDFKDLLSDKLNCRLYAVVQALRSFDTKNAGRILSTNLHNVLNIFCHPLNIKEFNELLKEENLDEKGFIDYISFLSKLTNKKKELHNALNYKENGLYKNVQNTEEIEVKMKQKIGRNLKNFVRSMRLYDRNHDGFIQKHEFRNILENYCFHLTEGQFNRLWSVYDPTNKGVLNYKDFLLKLGTRSESYKRIMPRGLPVKLKVCSPSFNVTYSRNEQVSQRCAKLGRDDPSIQGQIFDNIIEAFKKKIQRTFPVLLRTFQIKDANGSGFIPLTVFHQVLNYFVMPMSSQLFKQILMSFNVSPNSNKIQWYVFLKNVCTNNANECQKNTYMTGSYSWHVCQSVFKKLRENRIDPDNFFANSFIITSKNDKKVITRAELRRTINQYITFPVTEEEFRSLMFALDPSHSNYVNCETVLSILKTSPSETSRGITKKMSDTELQSVNSFAELSDEKLKKEFKKSFNKNLKYIEKAINAFDAEETGFMPLSDLRKLLENFCFPLSNSQCSEIFNSFPTYSNKIYYNDFIDYYKKSPYEDEENWALCVKKLTDTKDTVKNKMNNQEILRQVKEAIKSQKETFLEEFKNYDYCNTGIVRKEVLSKLLDKYVFRMTEDQLNMIWNLLPLNEIGLLKYEVFLNDFIKDYRILSANSSSNVSSHKSSQLLSHSTKKSIHSATSMKERPKTAGSVSTIVSSNSYKSRPKSAVTKYSSEHYDSQNNESNRGGNESRLAIHGQGCSVLTNDQYKQFRTLNFENVKTPSQLSASNSMTKLKDLNQESKMPKKSDTVKERYCCYDKKLLADPIKARWRDILRRCKVKDPTNCNSISWDDFISIFPKTGIAISDEIIDILNIEYNLKKNAPVNYWIFLKKVLLSLDSHNVGFQKAIQNSKMAPSEESVGLYKVLLTNRNMKNYRDLRYAFRKADQKRCGSIKVSEFRRILALNKIYLSEDDFFYICDYFDPKLTEKIHYDEFLEAFKQK